MLKNLKRSKSLFLLTTAVSTFLLCQNVSGQIAVGTAESNWGGNQAQVRNTGNFVEETISPQAVESLGITVWDGADPGIGMDYTSVGGSFSGMTPLIGGITDPDVAAIDDGHCTAVVYERGGDIYVQGFTMDWGVGLVPVTGPVLVSNGSGNARYPNIDVDINHNSGVGSSIAAIVWEEDNSIYTRTVELCNVYDLSPTVILEAGNPQESFSEPDVSVSINGGNLLFNYTYVLTDDPSGTSSLIYRIEEGAPIYAGSTATVHFAIPAVEPIGEPIRAPRIASHDNNTGYPIVEASAITYMIPANNLIMTYSDLAGVNDVTLGLSSCRNMFPAICWSIAGEYVVGWQYRGSCAGAISQGWDLIATKLDADGVPTTTSIPNYQWINDAQAGHQGALSLASRHSESANIYTGFYDDNTELVLYKHTSSFASPFFRGSGSGDVATALDENLSDESLFAIYPNPVSNVLSITAKEMTSVILYNTAGQIVHSFNKTDLMSQSVLSIDVTDLPSGIYLLKANGNDKTYTEKIIVEK